MLKRKSFKNTISYWRNPNDASNDPKSYLQGETKSRFLLKVLLDLDTPKSSKILELGCNVGRNLNMLFENGYDHLSGVEINTNAIRLMGLEHAKILPSTQIFNNTIEEQLKHFKDNQYDVIFTMAVLMHIHKDSEFIFKEIARVTASKLIIIENESSIAIKNFSRNYNKIFTKLGLTETQHMICGINEGFTSRFVCRVFKKNT